MSSAAKLAANQANAKHSTGPRTEAGKSISAQNATRHGLAGKQIVIPGEDPAEYDALRTELYDSYEPANAAEKLLVDQIAAASWRLQRAQKMEAAVLTNIAGAKGLAATFMEMPETLTRLQRYMAGFERAYYRAIKELQMLQKDRSKKEAEIIRRRPDPVIATWAAPVECGFVPQNVSADADTQADPLPKAA